MINSKSLQDIATNGSLLNQTLSRLVAALQVMVLPLLRGGTAPWVASGNVLRSAGTDTAPAWGKVDLTADVSGTLPLANGGTNSTVGALRSPSVTGIGYATGAGGTVTQTTSKSTGVTLDTACGNITMNAAALNGDTTVSFTLTNSSIAATDVLILNHVTAGSWGSYLLNARCAAGFAIISVRNITTGSLSQAIVIRFVLIKGATA